MEKKWIYPNQKIILKKALLFTKRHLDKNTKKMHNAIIN